MMVFAALIAFAAVAMIVTLAVWCGIALAASMERKIEEERAKELSE
jgi:hypothetical protein